MWEHAGIICTSETYKNAVKLTVARGASLEDPSHLFNSSLERQHQAPDRGAAARPTELLRTMKEDSGGTSD